jgi:hypothetical protein
MKRLIAYVPISSTACADSTAAEWKTTGMTDGTKESGAMDKTGMSPITGNMKPEKDWAGQESSDEVTPHGLGLCTDRAQRAGHPTGSPSRQRFRILIRSEDHRNDRTESPNI